jgi:hypothetical protein
MWSDDKQQRFDALRLKEAQGVLTDAARLGCQPIANDYNPVAYLILTSGWKWLMGDQSRFPSFWNLPGHPL